jgi:hypothetical protein
MVGNSEGLCKGQEELQHTVEGFVRTKEDQEAYEEFTDHDDVNTLKKSLKT